MSNETIKTIGGTPIASLKQVPDYTQTLNATFLANCNLAYTWLKSATAFDYDKIPFILTTDQHSRLGEDKLLGVYRMLANTVDFQFISKVINLGDTSDTGLTADLVAWRGMSGLLPPDKQVNIWGNHDYGNDATFDQQYLKQYFFSEKIRRGGGNGYFVVYDDDYNVKYLVWNNMEHMDDVHYHTSMTTEQVAWIIDELSKNDGYDIIICSHWFLDCRTRYAYDEGRWYYPYDRPDEPFLTNAAVEADFLQMIANRKNKVSGVLTDDEGIAHSYDFSKCEHELLIQLSGHDHIDNYKHIEGSISEVGFDCAKTRNTIYYGYIDRKSKAFHAIKVWGEYDNLYIDLDLN